MALSPVLVGLSVAFGHRHADLIMVLIVLGLLSDVADGIVARHLGTATASLRRWDSQADMLFWLAVFASAFFVRPAVMQAEYWYFVGLLAGQTLCYVVSFVRFGREMSTHAFSAKMLGLGLLVAFVSIIGFGQGGAVVRFVFGLGMVSQADVLLIILLLPRWTHDIPSAYHAYRLRKGLSIGRHKLLN